MYEIKVEAEMEQLYTILDNLEEWLDENGCSLKSKTQINIAIEEVFANIVHYAYDSKNGEVIVKCKLEELDSENYISIQFMDNGRPYNPLENEEPDTNLSAEEREIGGLGILMVRKMMDKVNYNYHDNFNVLTLQKKI